MTNEARDRPSESTPDRGSAGIPSDLIGVRLTLYLGVAVIAILVAFFFIGVVAGIIVLVVALALGAFGLVATIRGADISD
jgi:hypothetical protein